MPPNLLGTNQTGAVGRVHYNFWIARVIMTDMTEADKDGDEDGRAEGELECIRIFVDRTFTILLQCQSAIIRQHEIPTSQMSPRKKSLNV